MAPLPQSLLTGCISKQVKILHKNASFLYKIFAPLDPILYLFAFLFRNSGSATVSIPMGILWNHPMGFRSFPFPVHISAVLYQSATMLWCRSTCCCTWVQRSVRSTSTSWRRTRPAVSAATVTLCHVIGDEPSYRRSLTSAITPRSGLIISHRTCQWRRCTGEGSCPPPQKKKICAVGKLSKNVLFWWILKVVQKC